MIGELAPVVMLPRFTSFVGGGTFTTAPLDVSEFSKVYLEFWRGELAGSQLSPAAAFSAQLEEASDPNPPGGTWTPLGSAITAVNTYTLEERTLTKRFFRIRIVLDLGNGGVGAITCWAAGDFERRIPGNAAT